MKKYLLVFFCTLTLVNTYGQDTIYAIAYNTPQPVSTFEDRDTADYFFIDTAQTNNLWQIGTPSKTIFNSAYSLPLALLTDTINTYPNGNISSFEFVIWTDDATLISFRHRFNTDSLSDGGVIEVSTDEGSTWINIINAPQFTLSNFSKPDLQFYFHLFWQIRKNNICGTQRHSRSYNFYYRQDNY